ncbi:YadA-like family protein, partial [Serratia fonticola]|uniref:YadA family autotransporter adhesin n=1 Tax=Serratia fonticola TaxID=47917 RepID=UPI00164763A2
SGGTRLSNVAAGELSTTSTDAVNGSQLNTTNDNVAANTASITANTTNINGLKDDALQWDASANGGNGAYSANHMGNGPAKITNVAAGELSATSSDAVNGSQLYSTNQQVAVNMAGLTALGNNVSTLQQDALLWDSSVNAFSAKHGATSTNKITNVAAGDLSAASTDAVNGSQLYTTNNRVSQIENTLTNIDLGTFKYVSVNSQGPAASAVGAEAVAVGPSASASGDKSIATGNNAQSSGSAAIALGSDASASGASSIAIGNAASSTADNAVALGTGSIADRNNTVSVGSADNQRQITNVAAGTEDTDAVNVAQLKSIASSVSTVNTDISELDNGTDGMFQVNNTSIKAKPQVTGTDALAGGAGASASGENSMAVGTGAQSSGLNAVALGSGASATAQNAIALGTNSLADRDNTVSVGVVGGERQITNVAAGTQGTDAVNVNQLNSGISSANQYTDSRFNSLKSMVDDNKDKMSAGIAGAMAMASLTQPYTPGASMVSIGSAAYQNQSAIALGVSTISESGKWVTKLQGNSNTQGDMGIAIGVGYQW